MFGIDSNRNSSTGLKCGRSSRASLRRLAFSMFLVASLPSARAQANASADAIDVLVYGGTPSGILAATSAASEGMHVTLLEPGRHVGGMVAGGLSYTDVDRQEHVVGGATLHFFQRMGQHYGIPLAWKFEPHVAEQTFTAMLSEAHVRVVFGEQVISAAKQGSRIVSLQTATHHAYRARVFIDSSYEGDLMKAAGVHYTVGREGAAQYGESLAGRQDLLPGVHNFRTDVYAEGLLANLPDDQVAPHITPQEKVAATGQGDGRFQSYCYRITVTDDPKNRIPIPAPPGYKPAQYELLRRYLESNPTINLRGVLGINRIPGGKGDTNSNGPVSLDYLGGNLDYPEASPERRAAIARAHLYWAVGLFYFLQHDPSVPKDLQQQVQAWGLPADEFQDTDHLPFQLYVREGRRMLGSYILTQKDAQSDRHKPDSIAVAGYNIDIREVQWLTHRVYRYPAVHDQIFTEGYLSQPVDPWEIPYRALLPRRAEATNLLVTSCISASTIAYASYRLEPTYMIAGESAGVAAALAVGASRPLQDVDIPILQAKLRARGQILAAPLSDTLRGPQ